MLPTYFRAGINLAFAVLLAAILGFVLKYFIPLMGPPDSLLRSSFAALETWILFLMIVAILAGVLVRAVIQGSLGGVR
jgi:hypothetical protein